MPHDVSLIATIAAAFGLAMLAGILAVRLRLPPLVGYLFAGILIGPATPGFVADMSLAGQLAEIGVMLLMFGVGLHFSLQDLMAVRRIAIPGAIVQIVVAVLMGMLLAWCWGWSMGAALVFGLCLSVASTVVLLRALEAQGLLSSLQGKIAVGWLVVEDLVMVMVLVLLPALAGLLTPHDDQAPNWPTLLEAIGWTLTKVAAFIALMLLVGRRLLPRLLWWVARTGSQELFTLSVIAVAVGVAFGAAKLFDVSFALGAFFAGMMMRESEFSHRAADQSLPLRDAFAVLFFVSVGMLFDPSVLWTQPLQLLMVVVIIMVGKTLAAMALTLLFRYPLSTALTVGVSLAQIGEFSFILAGLGIQLQLLPQQGHHLILAAALLSIALNPLLFSLQPAVQRYLLARSRWLQQRETLLNEREAAPAKVVHGPVIVAGYGRVGRRLVARLQAAQIPFVVIEQHTHLVAALQAQGMTAVCGSITDAEVLEQAGISKAELLVLAIPEPTPMHQSVALARERNPAIQVVLRSHNDTEAALLRDALGGTVFIGEQALADSMAGYIEAQMRDIPASVPAAGGHH